LVKNAHKQRGVNIVKSFNEKTRKIGKTLSEIAGVVKTVGNAVLIVFKVIGEIEKHGKQGTR